jgi:hypothetical protein
MSHTIFHSRRQQLARRTTASEAEDVRARRLAARRQVLDAFSLAAVATPSSRSGAGSGSAGGQQQGEGDGPGGFGAGEQGFSGSGSSNPNANAFATGLISLTSFDEDLLGPQQVADTALGLLGIANPLLGFVTQLAVGSAVQAGSPVGSLFSSPLANLLGFANVKTTTGLQTVNTGRVGGLSREQSFDAPVGTGFGKGSLAADQTGPTTETDIGGSQTGGRGAEGAESIGDVSSGGFESRDGPGLGGFGGGNVEATEGGSEAGSAGGEGGVGEGGGIGL